MSLPKHAVVIGLIAVLTLVSGSLLGEYSSAAWPFVDSFTTWASVITTYLVARKYLENWLYWLVIDSVSSAAVYRPWPASDRPAFYRLHHHRGVWLYQLARTFQGGATSC